MFGIPITTLISLAITYGPAVLNFVKAADPAIHQIVLAAAPLVAKIANSNNLSIEEAVTHGLAALAHGGANWTDDDLQRWWDARSAEA